jgi:acetamidase/formamidase
MVRNLTIATIATGFVALVAMTAPPASLLVSPQSSRELTGEWQLWRIARTGPNANTPVVLRLTVVHSGDSLVGSAPNGLRVTARTSGPDSVIWRGLLADRRTPAEFRTRWSGDSLAGSTNDRGVEMAVRLVRDPVRPKGAPTRHAYSPTAFHNVFTSLAPVALRIYPGDTVRTVTLDAGGRDSTGTSRAPGGNPLTGPFWIHGALPGDVIAIHLIRIRPNRTTARSGSELAWNAVDPEYVTEYKSEGDSGSSWTVDARAGVARLVRSSGALAGFAVSLKPMLGCVGVAPGPRNRPETRASSFPGTWGGNMDYNRVTEGATVYVPVSVPGAHLFVGDGHAAQGDAELLGSGLEISMDVEFSVELIRSKGIWMPRVEDANDIMSLGVGGSLDDAFKNATTELARWLESDYTLTRPEVAIVLGTSVQFDIGEVVDRDYTVAARLSKRVLASVGAAKR